MSGKNAVSYSLIIMRIIKNKMDGTKVVKKMLLLLNSRKKIIKIMCMIIAFMQILTIKKRNRKKIQRRIIELDH